MEEMHVDVAEEVAVENDTPVASPRKKEVILNFVKKLFSPANRIKTISAIAASVVLIIVVFGVLHYLSPSAVALRYANADLWRDAVALKQCYVHDYYAYSLGEDSEDEYFEYVSDEYDEDIKSWRDISRLRATQEREWLEDKYGEYRVSHKVTRVKDISNNKMKEEQESWLETLEEEGLFDADTIKDSKVVTVKRKISGEDDIARDTIKVYLVKVNGQWKVLDGEYE